MRKLVYHIATSLDNFIAHPDGSVKGFLMEGAFVADFVESIRSYDAVLLGRNTYEWGYAFGLQKGQPVYTQINPTLKNYLFSSSIDVDSTDQLRVVREDSAGFVRQLKAESGGPLWLCGGGDLAGRLLDAQLIDELVLKVNPIVLGNGIPLFGSSQTRVGLHLVETKSYDNGVVRLAYEVVY